MHACDNLLAWPLLSQSLPFHPSLSTLSRSSSYQIPSSLFSTPPSADSPFSVIQGSALHHWHHAAPTPSPAISASTSTPGSTGPHSVPTMPHTVHPGMAAGTGAGMGPAVAPGMGPAVAAGMTQGTGSGMGSSVGPGMGPSVGPGMGPSVGPAVGPPVGPAPIMKQFRRLEVPVEQYPNFNFVGRLLGPRGHSLKRVEAQTSCRILIRGRGSIKDPNRVRAERYWVDNVMPHHAPLHRTGPLLSC